ncbi:MAG TPA: hypothetical protein VIM11_22610 [Tepidisphaeraceae bacterium]|jgi:hypothetical protein
MDWLAKLLFGVKPARWAAGGHWRLEFLAAPRHDMALVAGLVAMIGAWGVWYLYRKEGRGIRLPMQAVLAGLRMIVLVMVVVMMLEPELVFTRQEMIPSNLVVLKDASDSIQLRDAYADTAQAEQIAAAMELPGKTNELRQQTRAQLADRLLKNGLLEKLSADGDRRVSLHEFTGQILSPTTAQTATHPTIDRAATAIGAAIRQAIAGQQGQPLAGILLLSDGDSNTGEAPAKAAEFAAAEGVPVVSIALGTPEGPRNAKIVKLDVSPVVFVRDSNTLHVLIESRGMTKQNATVVLERARDGGNWEEVGRQALVLEESGRVQTAEFAFNEQKPARLQMRARLEDVGPQINESDLVAVADVRAISEKIRVLFIAGETFPEVEFIRNAITRDKSLVASTWLQTADPNYEQPGQPSIKALPATMEELDEYDCVVLYDPDPTLWSSEFPQMLSDFVSQSGGGLIYIAGERNTKDLFDHPDDPASLWLSLLPVVVEPGLYHTDVSVRLSAREAWKLEIPQEGMSDAIFSFAEKPEQNAAVISNLPGMYWHFPVTRAKPGATVLARHGDPRMRNEYGQHVLLATQLVGPGRSFFVGFDSTYRWRYLDDQYFAGFWARMIDRAGRNKRLGGRYPYSLSADRASYRPGSQVTLTARFNNPSDRDRAIEALHGEVEAAGSSSPQAITLVPKAGEPAAFETNFTVDKSGMYSVRVWNGDPDAQGNVRAATLQIPVELANPEFDQLGRDIATLQNIARITGGQVFDLATASKTADAFKIHRVARTLEDRQEVWDGPIFYGTMLAALFAEWVLRKRCRLV